MKKSIIIVFVCILASLLCEGQVGLLQDDNKGQPKPIHLHKVVDKIVIDGVLDEETWDRTERNSHFTQYFPNDGQPATRDTEVYISYDNEYLYIAAKCSSIGSDFRVESLRRDFSFSRNDNINFILDTYNDRTNAFQFSMNPVGALKEALISIEGKSSAAFAPVSDIFIVYTEEIFIEHPKHVHQHHVEGMQRHLFDEDYMHPSTGKSATHTSWIMDKILEKTDI